MIHISLKSYQVVFLASLNNKKQQVNDHLLLYVGMRRLERPTPTSRTQCATNCATSRQNALSLKSDCKVTIFYWNKKIFEEKYKKICRNEKIVLPLHPQTSKMVPQLSWQSKGLKILVSPVRFLVVPLLLSLMPQGLFGVGRLFYALYLKRFIHNVVHNLFYVVDNESCFC